MRSAICALAILCFASLPALMSQESTAFKLTDDEKAILDMTNAARKQYSLPPLLPNATLTKAARAHSLNMASQKKMAHELDGKTPFDRITAAGYKFSRAGENVAYGQGQVSIQEIFEGWMNSEGHRKNILSREFAEIGLGLGVNGDEKYYTQVFGRRLR